MNLDSILNTAISRLKASFPEAVYKGSLIKKTRAFDASTNTTTEVIAQEMPAEFIFDGFKLDEISSSSILATDVKIHVIANEVKSIDFYDAVVIGDDTYQIIQKTDTVVGAKAALFTIVARR